MTKARARDDPLLQVQVANQLRRARYQSSVTLDYRAHEDTALLEHIEYLGNYGGKAAKVIADRRSTRFPRDGESVSHQSGEN